MSSYISQILQTLKLVQDIASEPVGELRDAHIPGPFP